MKTRTRIGTAGSMMVLLLGFASVPAVADELWNTCKGKVSMESISACVRLLSDEAIDPGVSQQEILEQMERSQQTLSSYLALSGAKEPAFADLDEAHRQDAAEALALRGAAREASHPDRGALRDYDAALAIKPKLIVQYRNRTISVRESRNDVAKTVDLDWDDCLESVLDDPARRPTKEQRIAGCSRIIDRGEAESVTGRAEALKQRADSHGTVFALQWGPHARAVADLNAALRLIPGDAEALLRRGKHYQAMGRYDVAMADLDLAIALNPANADGFDARAELHRERGNEELAKAELDKALSIDPKHVFANLHAQWDEAVVALLAHPTIMTICSKETEALSDERIAACTAACTVQTAAREPAGPPRQTSSPATLLPSLKPLSLSDQKIGACTVALGGISAASPERGALYKARGGAHADEQDYDQAIADFDEALRITPKDAALLVLRGEAKAAKGDRQQATADYRMALIVIEPSSLPAQGEADLTWLRCGAASGTADETIQACTAMLERGESLPRSRRILALSRRADAYLLARKHDKAMQDYKAVLNMDPDHAEAKQRIEGLDATAKTFTELRRKYGIQPPEQTHP